MNQRLKLTLSVVVFLSAVAGLFMFFRARLASQPEEILKRMAQAYKICASYQDKGTVKMTLGGRPLEGDFTTVYLKPDRFRFEFKGKLFGKENRFIVWRDGAKVDSWTNRMPLDSRPRIFSIRIAGATGVTGSAALTIPALLFPQEIGNTASDLADMTEVQRLSDNNIGKDSCFRLKGKYKKTDAQVDEEITVWLDKRNFLVRRVDTKNGAMWESQTSYEPVFNSKIEETALSFNAPAQ